MAKKLLALVSVVAVMVVLFFVANYNIKSNSTPSKQMLLTYINDNYTVLLSIANDSPDQYIKSEEITNVNLPYTLGFDLHAVDTRGQGIKFYYPWSYSDGETTKYIAYFPDERLSFGDLVLETPQNENQTITVDDIGINGEGYIKYHHITDNWYFFEAYLPT